MSDVTVWGSGRLQRDFTVPWGAHRNGDGLDHGDGVGLVQCGGAWWALVPAADGVVSGAVVRLVRRALLGVEFVQWLMLLVEVCAVTFPLWQGHGLLDGSVGQASARLVVAGVSFVVAMVCVWVQWMLPDVSDGVVAVRVSDRGASLVLVDSAAADQVVEACRLVGADFAGFVADEVEAQQVQARMCASGGGRDVEAHRRWDVLHTRWAVVGAEAERLWREDHRSGLTV